MLKNSKFLGISIQNCVGLSRNVKPMVCNCEKLKNNKFNSQKQETTEKKHLISLRILARDGKKLQKLRVYKKNSLFSEMFSRNSGDFCFYVDFLFFVKPKNQLLKLRGLYLFWKPNQALFWTFDFPKKL